MSGWFSIVLPVGFALAILWTIRFRTHRKQVQTPSAAPNLTVEQRLFSEYERLEEQSPTFADAAARVRRITGDESFRYFVFAMLERAVKLHSAVSTANEIEWIISNFEAQVEREQREIEVPPDKGWSVQEARRIAALLSEPIGNTGFPPDFYFPQGSATGDRWFQNLHGNFSLTGIASHVTEFGLSSCEISFANSDSLKSNLRDFEAKAVEFVGLVTSCPLPAAIGAFLQKLSNEGLTPFASSRKHSVTGNGYEIEVSAKTGFYHTDPDIGTVRVTIRPTNTARK